MGVGSGVGAGGWGQGWGLGAGVRGGVRDGDGGSDEPLCTGEVVIPRQCTCHSAAHAVRIPRPIPLTGRDVALEGCVPKPVGEDGEEPGLRQAVGPQPGGRCGDRRSWRLSVWWLQLLGCLCDADAARQRFTSCTQYSTSSEKPPVPHRVLLKSQP
jgi:hypothetical protein